MERALQEEECCGDCAGKQDEEEESVAHVFVAYMAEAERWAHAHVDMHSSRSVHL